MGEFDDLIEEFVTESREHIADIEDDLIKIEADMENVDPDVINRVFRAAHSIKGSAKFLDLVKIGDLSHIMEDVLNLIRSGKLKPSPAVAGPLLQAADMLKNMFEDVTASNEMDISEHVEQLKLIRDGDLGETPQSSKASAAQTGLPHFDIADAVLQEKMKQGQVFAVNIDTNAFSADEIAEELGNLGEILAKAQDGNRVSILFSSIMEASMIPMATNLSAEDVIQIEPDMVAALKGQPAASQPAPKPAPQQPAAPVAQKPQEEPVQEVSQKTPSKEEVEQEEQVENMSFITFSLETETYAVPIQRVEEIIGVQEMSLLPNVPDFIKGVINLRGEIVPIMDLRSKFAIQEREWDAVTVFLIVRSSDKVVGLVVDQVSDVLVIDPALIQKTPSFSAGISTDFIKGVYKDQTGQMVIIVDLESLIKPEEWSLFEDLEKLAVG